jgi:drug/metabolite transporter superfamily protein YnfA
MHTLLVLLLLLYSTAERALTGSVHGTVFICMRLAWLLLLQQC